jgi:hypothetical protein
MTGPGLLLCCLSSSVQMCCFIIEGILIVAGGSSLMVISQASPKHMQFGQGSSDMQSNRERRGTSRS